MKKVISVTLNEDGTIKGLLFEGNKKATPLTVVIRMLADGKDIDLTATNLEVVHRESGAYVRMKANDTVEDNLGHMADEVVAEEVAKDTVWEEIKEAEVTSPGIIDKVRAFLASLKLL